MLWGLWAFANNFGSNILVNGDEVVNAEMES